MSKFFKAMQEAARESGETTPLPLPDATRLTPVETPTLAAPAVEEAGERISYLRVTPQPVSATILPPLDGPYSRIADQYRIIRTKIVQHPARPRLLTVSSAGIGDGKTVSAVNIAGALAMKAGTSVLLVDTDLRRPRIAEALGIDHLPGLTAVLRGEATLQEAIHQIDGQSSLFVFPPVKRPPTPLNCSTPHSGHRLHGICAIASTLSSLTRRRSAWLRTST